MEQLKTGCDAYFDCFAGLVPVKVLSVRAPKQHPVFDLVHGTARASIQVVAEVTESMKPYCKGEVITSCAIWVVPRGAVKKNQHSWMIHSYTVVPDPELETEPA